MLINLELTPCVSSFPISCAHIHIVVRFWLAKRNLQTNAKAGKIINSCTQLMTKTSIEPSATHALNGQRPKLAQTQSNWMHTFRPLQILCSAHLNKRDKNEAKTIKQREQRPNEWDAATRNAIDCIARAAFSASQATCYIPASTCHTASPASHFYCEAFVNGALFTFLCLILIGFLFKLHTACLFFFIIIYSIQFYLFGFDIALWHAPPQPWKKYWYTAATYIEPYNLAMIAIAAGFEGQQ